jgi:hypothetical protein
MAAKKDEEKKLKEVLSAFLKVKPLPKKQKKPSRSRQK